MQVSGLLRRRHRRALRRQPHPPGPGAAVGARRRAPRRGPRREPRLPARQRQGRTSNPAATSTSARCAPSARTGAPLPGGVLPLGARPRRRRGPAGLDHRRHRRRLRLRRQRPHHPGVARRDLRTAARRRPRGVGPRRQPGRSARSANSSSPGRCPRCRRSSGTTPTARATATPTSRSSRASGATATGSPAPPATRHRLRALRLHPQPPRRPAGQRRHLRRRRGPARVREALVIGAELGDGGYWMPLFVVLDRGAELDDDLPGRITTAIRTQASPRHVPDDVLAVTAHPAHPHRQEARGPGQTADPGRIRSTASPAATPSTTLPCWPSSPPTSAGRHRASTADGSTTEKNPTTVSTLPAWSEDIGTDQVPLDRSQRSASPRHPRAAARRQPTRRIQEAARDELHRSR